MNKKYLLKAVKAVGGQAEMARKLTEVTGTKFTQQRVWNWVHRDSQLPAEVAIPIEKVVEGKVTRHQLRPDIYPQDGAAA